MNPSELENLSLYVDWIITTLKTQDRFVTEAFKRSIRALVSPECLKKAFLLGLYKLAESDISTCVWALSHYDIQVHLELKRDITHYAVTQLLNHGFVLGQDFSSYPDLGLLVHPAARAFLVKDSHPFVALLLQEILYTPEPDPIV